MTHQQQARHTIDWLARTTLCLAFILVILGLANNSPNIPGLLELVQSIPGLAWVPRLSKFDGDYFLPLTFSLMLIIALLEASFAKAWREERRPKFLIGLGLDLLMFATIIGVAFVYLAENDQVCLIDVMNGERARLVQESLSRVQEYIDLFGVAPAEDPPACQTRLGIWIVPFLLFTITVFFTYIIRVWGLPIVMVAIVIALYTVLSSLAWYFDWTSNRYLSTSIGTLVDGVRNYDSAIIGARNAITQNSNGLLGQFLDITVNTVFPYVVLGSLFGVSAGGRSLIKLAVLTTRRLRGGPAHAAIVGSALFGTVSGGPVVNVLGTGTLTIPMMMRNGFSGRFAGGVESAASSGGQIMPPVMGVAAFVLAALSTVPYSQVIIAAFIPALAYFISVFLAVVLEARRKGIEPVGDIGPEQKLTREDWKNLLMIAGPILTILVLLLSTKDNIGTGFFGYVFGYDPASGEPLPWLLKVYQNAAGDPDSTGFWAVVVLVCLLFLDPEVRARPSRVLRALANSGKIIANLFLLLIAVSVIDVCLSYTNFTGILTVDILNWLKSASTIRLFGHELVIGGALYLMLALVMAMVATMLLGMGMPTLPAYVNVILIIGPLLAALGTSNFAAHMFVFYFAAASAITPPVAIAAFAASTISKSDPLATGMSAVKIGIVMFFIPFVFAFYPELLLIEAAQVMQSLEGGLSSTKTYLPGYDGTIDPLGLCWILIRLMLALYLVATALSRFDRHALSSVEIALRLVLAVLVLIKIPLVAIAGCGVAVALLAAHWLGALRAATRLSGVKDPA